MNTVLMSLLWKTGYFNKLILRVVSQVCM